MKNQGFLPEMLEKLAESMNLSIPEFEKMMGEGHGLIPPDKNDEDDDSYYEPPKRVNSVVPMSLDTAGREADRRRTLLLNPDLPKHEAEQIANELAQCVSAYGEVDQRMEELTTPREFDSDAHSNAERLEHNALIQVQQDKIMTTHEVDSLNSMASTLGLMNRGKLAGQNIDLIALKEGIEKQVDELVTSGTAREKRIAQFVILAQEAAEKLMIKAALAPTAEATAMVMEKATNVMEKATKMLKKLDEMAAPKTGRIIEPMQDEKLTQKIKKLSEPTTGVAS